MRRALAAAAALSVCLSGCSGDDRSPTSTTSRPPPTGVTSDSTGPTDTTPTDDPGGPPVLPDAAKAKTTAGAKAFVKYYVATINFAYLEMDARPLRAVAAKACTVCRLLSTQVASMSRSGGAQRGGLWHVIEAAPTTPLTSSVRVVAKIKIDEGAIRKSKKARPTSILARTVVDEFALAWKHGWLVTDVRPS